MGVCAAPPAIQRRFERHMGQARSHGTSLPTPVVAYVTCVIAIGLILGALTIAGAPAPAPGVILFWFAAFLAGAAKDKRLSYIVFVSPDLEKRFPAGKLAKLVGSAMGGGGGGKPSLASGGGEIERLGAAQDAFRAALSSG